MNKLVNVTSLLILVPALLFSAYIGLDIPIDSLGITGQEIPHKESVFLCAAFICFLLHFFRSLKRWTALYIVSQKAQFKFSYKLATKRKYRIITYTFIEILFLLLFAYAFYTLTITSLAMTCMLIISALDSFFFVLIGFNKFKIIVTSKAVFVADREVISLYLKGLRKVSIHQQSIYFDYIKDIQLFFPLNCFEEKDVSSFLSTIDNLTDNNKVYFSNTNKYFKRK